MLAPTLFSFFLLLFFNIVAFATYKRSAGAVYICTNRRYLIIRRKAFGKLDFIALPRRGAGYVGIRNRDLVLYNDIGRRKGRDIETPEGFLELDDVQGAIRAIEVSEPRPSPTCPEPNPLCIGDLGMPAAQREHIGQVLEAGEKLLYAAMPARRFGGAQVLGLLGLGGVCWGAFALIRSNLMSGNINWGEFIAGVLLGSVFFGILLLIAAVPLLHWWRRCTTFFILTDRRACELDSSSGNILQSWQATPDLIKKATLRSNGTGDFLFSLNRASTTRWDAGDSETGVDALPDAPRLMALINSLPQP